jgi:ribosome-associated heat shock protein Hsp15
MSENKTIRIDKYLWAVRVYKTRSMASDACRKGKIIINNIQVKPSRGIVADEIIQVKKPPLLYTFRVIEPIEKRVSTKIAGQFVEDLTSNEEKEKLIIRQSAGVLFREKGSGRPTKRDRRVIDKLNEGFSN